MTRDELIEVMARAIGRQDGIPDELWSSSVPHATAALTAIEAAGMRVVPAVFQNPTFDPNSSNRATPPAQEDSTSE